MSQLFLARALVPYEVAMKRGMTDPYAWHQRSWDAFPQRDKMTRDFLTRMELKNEVIQLLILAASEPQKPDWCPSPGWQVKAVPADYFQHQVYDFSLLANPTRKLRNGARVGLIHPEDKVKDGVITHHGQLPWLKRQAQENGFVVDEASLEINGHPFRRFIAKEQKVTLHAVDFKGRLTVTDPEAFRRLFFGRPDPNDPQRLVYGIGRGKGFGFGLLSIVPIS
jgi:CRISPR-associated protein Cas6/Cse3/CasE subtype I-E